MILDPWFLAFAIPAVLTAGISKAGFGGGLVVLAVPLMALAVSPVQAAAILLPILCAMDIMGLAVYRRIADFRNLTIMIPGALAGIAVGTFTFEYLNDDVIRLIIGTIALVFTFQKLLNVGPKHEAPGPSISRGTFWSGLAGFTSFVAHSGAPPVQFYLLPQRLDKSVYVGTTVWFFTVVNYIKLIPYGFLGQLSFDNLATSAMLLPLAPLGIWMGLRLHRIVSDTVFYRIAHVFLLIAGVKLVWDGVTGLLAA